MGSQALQRRRATYARGDDFGRAEGTKRTVGNAGPVAAYQRGQGVTEMSDPLKVGMTFFLTAEQVKLVNEWIGPINVAHFDEGCLPPGFEIVISFAGPYGCRASARSCGEELELGEVEISPEHNGSWCL